MTFQEALKEAALRALAIDDAKHRGHPLPHRAGFDWWSECRGDLDNDLNWLLYHREPGYHDRLRQQQMRGKSQFGYDPHNCGSCPYMVGCENGCRLR